MSAEEMAGKLSATQLYVLGLIVFDRGHQRPDGDWYGYDPGAYAGGKAGGAYVALDDSAIVSLERLGLVTIEGAWVRATAAGREVDQVITHA